MHSCKGQVDQLCDVYIDALERKHVRLITEALVLELPPLRPTDQSPAAALEQGLISHPNSCWFLPVLILMVLCLCADNKEMPWGCECALIIYLSWKVQNFTPSLEKNSKAALSLRLASSILPLPSSQGRQRVG